MKKVLLSILFVAGIMSLNNVKAQEKIKLGHINFQELLAALPESDSAQAKIQKAAEDLQSQMEEMQVEFNNKYENYLNAINNTENPMSDLRRQAKETELQDLQQRIQEFEGIAQQDIQQQRQTLFKPILDKANKAVEEVANENGFTYIFDTSQGVVLYTAENSKDIMGLVRTKLGLE